MKKTNFIIIAILGLMTMFLSSCSSSQTFIVQGVPGTVITNPQNQQIAVLDNSGQTKIKMKRSHGYYHYLQAQAPGSGILVPFALDYRNHSRAAGRDLQTFAGGLIMGAGALCEIVAAAMAIGGDFEDLGGGTFLGAGLGGLLVGGIVTGNAAGKDGIDYDYDYKKIQATNSDIVR